MALSMIVWGVALGVLVPFVHRPLHESIEAASKHAEIGPNAAARRNGPVRKEQQGPRQ